MNRRPVWQHVARQVATLALRQSAPDLVFTTIERAVPRYARLCLRAGGRMLPASLRLFPEKVAPLLGTTLGPEERARLIEARLVFLLTRVCLIGFLRAQNLHGRRLLAIEVRGADHLEAARAEGRGVILVSAHFGFPALIRPVLEDRGIRVVSVGARAEEGIDVGVAGDLWTRARGLQRLRGELADNRGCVVLADLPRGRYMTAPFLAGRIPVALGAFGLAQITGSPLLPFFGMSAGGSPRFRLEFGSPLATFGRSGALRPTAAVAGFVHGYETVARSHPSHLFGFDRLFG